jgi:hypothetical protein
MSQDFSMIVPIHEHKIEVLMPEIKPVQAELGTVQLTPEQLQARDAVLTSDGDNKEADQVAGLIGIWTGTMLLHDLAIEHLGQPTEEQLPERKKTKDEEEV